MRDTVVSFLTAKAKLAGVAVAAAALSTSAVAVTTVSTEEDLADPGVVELVEQPTTGGEAVEPGDEELDGEGADGLEGEDPALEAGDDPHTADDGTAAAGGLPPCPADVKNHGAYVSSVARDKSVHGAERGARVSAAAKSDCGKKSADAAEATDEVAETPAEEGTVDQQSVEEGAPKAHKTERKAAAKQGKGDRAGGRSTPKSSPSGKGGGKR